MKIVFLGDTALRHEPHKVPDSPRLDPKAFRILSSSSWTLANLEGPITDVDIPVIPDGRTNVRSRSEILTLLKESKVSAVTLANNHILDFGEEGVADTISTLDSASIDSTGYVSPDSKREFWRRFQVEGINFSLVSACYRFDLFSSSSPRLLELKFVEQMVKEERTMNPNRFIMVSLHMGIEHYSLPSIDDFQLCKRLAQTGANIIIGHHSHIAQPVEMLDGCLVAYGLGNFYFPILPRKRHRNHPPGIFLEVEIEKIDGRRPTIKSWQIHSLASDNQGMIEIPSHSKTGDISPLETSRIFLNSWLWRNFGKGYELCFYVHERLRAISRIIRHSEWTRLLHMFRNCVRKFRL